MFFFPIPFPLYYSASLLQSTYPNFLMIFGFPFKIPVTKFHLFELLVNYISNHFYSMPAQECYIYTKCLFKMLYSVCNVPIVIVFKIFNTHPNFFFLTEYYSSMDCQESTCFFLNLLFRSRKLVSKIFTRTHNTLLIILSVMYFPFYLAWLDYMKFSRFLLLS